MKILHLSDLHFDQDDPQENVRLKTDSMISYIKHQGGVNLVFITGDNIMYKNPQENYRLFDEFIRTLKTELSLSGEQILICSGNHEWSIIKHHSPSECRESFNKIKESGKEYIASFKTACERNWPATTLCEVYENDDLVIIMNEGFLYNDRHQKYFIRNCKQLRLLTEKYFTGDQRHHIILQHAPEEFYCHKCESCFQPDIPFIVCCGHKYFNHTPRPIMKGSKATVFSGVSDGIGEESPVYGLYEVKQDWIEVRYIIFQNGEWTNVSLSSGISASETSLPNWKSGLEKY